MLYAALKRRSSTLPHAPIFHVAARTQLFRGNFFHSSVSFCGSFSETLLLSSRAAVLHSPPTVARSVSVAIVVGKSFRVFLGIRAWYSGGLRMGLALMAVI